jgi:hypothetical protein
MASAILDFGAFSTAELTTLLTQAKAEYTLRLTTGRVRSGSSAAQSYGLDVMTIDQLIQLINGLSAQLGFSFGENRVQPNFSNAQPIPEQSTFGVGP